jgi:hypothetical protein
MNPTTSSHPTPPPPAGSTRPARGQHSTRRVVLAAVAGLALGAAGLGLLEVRLSECNDWREIRAPSLGG